MNAQNNDSSDSVSGLSGGAGGVRPEWGRRRQAHHNRDEREPKEDGGAEVKEHVVDGVRRVIRSQIALPLPSCAVEPPPPKKPTHSPITPTPHLPMNRLIYGEKEGIRCPNVSFRESNRPHAAPGLATLVPLTQQLTPHSGRATQSRAMLDGERAKQRDGCDRGDAAKDTNRGRGVVTRGTLQTGGS